MSERQGENPIRVVSCTEEEIMIMSEEHLMVAIIDDTIHTETPHGRAIRRIIEGLKEFGDTGPWMLHPADARAVLQLPRSAVSSSTGILGGDTKKKQTEMVTLIHEIRKRNEDIPIFLMAEPTSDTGGAHGRPDQGSE